MKLSEVMIIEELESIKKNAEEILGKDEKNLRSGEHGDKLAHFALCKQTDEIIKEYNWIIPSTNLFFKNIEIDYQLKEIKKIDPNWDEVNKKNIFRLVDPKLRAIILKTNRALSILKNIATSTKEIKNKYGDLKKEIKDLEKDLPQPVIRDLYEAFEEFELNKRLGAVLICGRLIVFHLDKIKGNINEKVNKLKEKGFLLEKGSSEFIFKVDKGARELFSHDVNQFPSPSETISLLGDTVKLVKIITSYQKKIDKEQSTTGILAKVLKSAIELEKKN